MHTTSTRNDQHGKQWRWRRVRPWPVVAALVWTVVTAGLIHTPGVESTAVAAALPAQGPVARYLFNGNAQDSSGFGHNGVTHNVTLTSNRFGNGSSAYSFNGTDGYIEIPDNNALSLSTTGQLSISVWMRPGTLTFPDSEPENRAKEQQYVHWLGKGEGNQQEWAFRMYNFDDAKDDPSSYDNRSNRTSFYLFNLAAPSGQSNYGVGTYWQEKVQALTWYHYVAVVNKAGSFNNCAGNITLYKNGRLVSSQVGAKVRSQWCFTDTISGQTVTIKPQNGSAPLRVGTLDPGARDTSFFKGAIDNIYIYNRALSEAEVGQLYADTTP